MKTFIRITLFILISGVAPLIFATGDYVWEEKFKHELPKAEQGNAKAQYAIGEMYNKGKGVERDAKKAFDWHMKAANQGNKRSTYKIGLAYLKGKGVKQNNKKAYYWLKQSANKNYARAQYSLGEIYENGHGVSKNYKQAMKWYKEALKGGYGTATKGITRLVRTQKASKKKNHTKTNKPRLKSPPKPKPANHSSKSTKEKVLAGGWKKRNKAVEYLPSKATRCKDQGDHVECLSNKITRNIGMADISYTTKATLFNFKKNGDFKISYRNNVSKIIITDTEFSKSGRKMPATLGWQDSEHKLTCSIDNDYDRSLSCVKNKTQKIKLHRE